MSTIKTQRQQRAIAALVKYKKLGSAELQSICGQLNVPELIAGLRRNGWVIHCERIEVLDRDGQICRPGLYYLDDAHLAVAKGMVV